MMARQGPQTAAAPDVPPLSGPDVGYPIASVDRALVLLRQFLVRASITVSDAAELLGVSKSTAHRLLAMLQHHRFVQQDPQTKAYLGGSALLEIGLAMIGKLDVRTAAQPSLDLLVAETAETAHLVVLQPPNILFFDGRESPKAVRAGLRLGVTLPAQCTSAGKAILAGLANEEIRELWQGYELTGLTPNSVVSWHALEAELARVRTRGWASNHEESEEGLVAVAAAIRAPGLRSPVRAALVVAGPVHRMEDDRLEFIAALVVREAEMVAMRLASAP
jgi:IclR family transcriptional regulator, acetate operon repressor